MEPESQSSPLVRKCGQGGHWVSCCTLGWFGGFLPIMEQQDGLLERAAPNASLSPALLLWAV